MHRFKHIAATALFLLAGLIPAQAQYPNRPVTIIVSLAAGSGMDVLVRLYADRLSQSLGKPVVVENRPGASLMLAANAVAQAQPDGHTLLVSTSSAMAINLTLFKQVSYEPDRDFIPISLYVKSPFILVVNPDLPVKTVPDLIKYVKENQGKLSYSSPGAGVAQHLSMEYMKNQFGLEITHVPYRSTPQSIQDIAAGHIALGWAEAGASIPLIKDGKLRALAVSSATRLPLLPDVPPLAEAAPAPGFEAVSWHMLLAPAKTPRDIVDKLHAEMKRIARRAGPEAEDRDDRPDPVRHAGNRGLARLSQGRAGEVGRAGEEARAGRVAVAAHVPQKCGTGFATRTCAKTVRASVHAHRLELAALGVAGGFLEAVGDAERRAVGGVQHEDRETRDEHRRLRIEQFGLLRTHLPHIADRVAAVFGERLR